MCTPLCRFTHGIVDKYNLEAISLNGWVYIEISKVMYGLQHAVLLADQKLQNHCAPHGYFPMSHAPGMWTHTV
jgi:hypothetical protein